MFDMMRLAEIAAAHTKNGEINFIEIAHNDGCPATVTWDINDCTCSSVEFGIHQDQGRFERDYLRASQMNRKARRAAERAMRKVGSKEKAARARAASKTASSICKNRNTNGGKQGGAA